MAAPYEITLDALSALIGTAQCPQIVDICLEEDHALDPRVIPGAMRMPFAQAAAHPALGVERPCVIVCQKGLKLSQGVAAALRSQGRDARYLRGGMVAWAQAGLAAWLTDIALNMGRSGAYWAIPDAPNPQEMAQAWMLSRFVDPAPQWLFVQRDQLANVAARFEAGTLEVAHRITQINSPIKAQFQRFGALLEADPLPRILKAHCNSGPASGKWLEHIYPTFDAIWVCAGEAEK